MTSFSKFFTQAPKFNQSSSISGMLRIKSLWPCPFATSRSTCFSSTLRARPGSAPTSTSASIPGFSSGSGETRLVHRWAVRPPGARWRVARENSNYQNFAGKEVATAPCYSSQWSLTLRRQELQGAKSVQEPIRCQLRVNQRRHICLRNSLVPLTGQTTPMSCHYHKYRFLFVFADCRIPVHLCFLVDKSNSIFTPQKWFSSIILVALSWKMIFKMLIRKHKPVKNKVHNWNVRLLVFEFFYKTHKNCNFLAFNFSKGIVSRDFLPFLFWSRNSAWKSNIVCTIC